jgi:hypothetical protein
MTGGGGLEFRVLGPIEVSDDGRDLALGGRSSGRYSLTWS